MGYSISAEQHEKLERNRRQGRLCAMATGRGGCFTRAIFKITALNWHYATDKQAGLPPVGEGTMTFCKRHATQTPVGYEGANFTVIKVEAY